MSTTERIAGDVASEFLARIHAGETPDVDEWLRRYPDHADELGSVLRTLQALHTRVQDLQPNPQHNLEGTLVGDFRLEENVGHGGMGRVYAATCLKTQQRVAVKMLAGGAGRVQKEKRLRQEFEILRQLQHSSFACVYDLFHIPSGWFLVMEFVDGDNLSNIVREHGPLPVEEAVRIVRDIAVALYYAHQRGVVHRDLKPANVMLDNDGLVRVVDFGLATFRTELVELTDTLQQMQSLADDCDRLTTASTELLGTLAYMAPEQALQPSEVDGRADIYSLGCTLYFLLTGASPFGKRSTLATLIAQREERPPAPSAVNTDVPRWLERLCLQMLLPQPHRRPQSMAEIVKILDRHTADSVQQRCLNALSTTSQRLLKNWPRVTLLATVLLLATILSVRLAAFVGMPFSSSNNSRFDGATAAHHFSVNSPSPSTDSDLSTQRLLSPERKSERTSSAVPGQFVSASGRTFSVLETIGDGTLRHWNYISDVAYTHDGQRLVSGSWDGTVVVWNAESGKQLSAFTGNQWVTDVDISFDDRHIAIGWRGEGTVVWDWQMDRVIDRFQWADGSEDSSVTFHPEQPLLAICNDVQSEIVIRNFETGQTVGRWTVDAVPDLACVCFTSDGNRLLSLGERSGVRLWDWQYGRLIRTWTADDVSLRTLCVHPQAPEFAVGDADGFVRVYRFSDSQPLNSARAHDAPCRRVVYSADGTLLFTSGEDQRIQAFDAQLSSVKRVIAEHTRSNWGLAPHPYGQWLASCGTDQEILQWQTQDTNQRRGPARPWNRVMSLDFGPATDALLLGCADGTMKLRGRPAADWQTFADHHREVVAVRFRPHHPDTAASASRDGTVRLWDLSQGISTVIHEHPSSAFCVAWSADGDWLASGGWDRTVRVTNLSRKESFTLTGHLNMVNSVAFCGTPVRLFSVDGDRMSPWQSASLRVWDLASQQEQYAFAASSALMATSPVPESQTCLFAGYEAAPLSAASVITQSGGRLISPAAIETDHERICWSIAVHPHQKLAAMGDGQGELTLWKLAVSNTANGGEAVEPLPDAASKTELSQLWDSVVIGPPTGELPAVCFDPSGHQLGVVQGDGQLLVIGLPSDASE